MSVTVLRQALGQPSMEASKAAVNQLSVMELTQALMQIDYRKRAIAFRLLNKDKAIRVFEYLSHEQQAELIESMEAPEVLDIVESLDPDDRVQLFEELPAKVAKHLIADLSPESRAAVDALLGYPQKSVGRMMSPRYLAIKAQKTAGEALQAIRESALDADELEMIFVVDAERYYRGCIWLANLVKASPDCQVLMLTCLSEVAARAIDPEMQAVKLLKDHDLPAVPVVDDEGRLVGAVTFDDAIDLMDEETTDSAYAQAGVRDLRGQDRLRSHRLVQGSIWYSVRLRLVFLLITLVGGLLVGGVIEWFEETLEAVVAAAVFIPLVMDMGGNVGTQSSTIFSRGLAWQQIDVKNFFPYLLREIIVGIIIGGILGIAAGAIAYVWQGLPHGIPQLGIAVGLALFGAVVLGCFLGAILPWVVLKLGFDQATASGPFLTTLKDFLALLLYFSLVDILIGVT